MMDYPTWEPNPRSTADAKDGDGVGIVWAWALVWFCRTYKMTKVFQIRF